MNTRMLEVTGLKDSRVGLTATHIEKLGTRLAGPLLAAGDDGWDEAVLVWNAMVSAVPRLVVQPVSAEDVATVVRFAADHGVLLSVKGGGHNIGGTALADGGLTLDMSRMREVTVDPAPGSHTRARGACCRTWTGRPSGTGWRRCSGSCPRPGSPG